MRIALDAMGGDHAPEEIVAGAVEAAGGLTSITKVILVGDQTRIEAEFAKLGPIPDRIEVHHASEVIEMAEAPALAVRKKKDSSIGRCCDLVKKGDADAVVSAGNTGAAVVAATLKLRTLGPVARPAIACVMPTFERPFLLVDAGANIDCDAKLLCQFAAMGTVYSREILGVEEPVVGLLSIGGEETKGNEVTKEVFKRLSDSGMNFRGNVEGHDLFQGETDVIVCDGFVGNVVLKTSESAAHAIGRLLKKELTGNAIRWAGTALLSGALREIKKQVDPASYGGAPLLGVNGVCIITHGSSKRNAIFHAVRVAAESIHHHLNNQISEEIEKNGL